MTITAIDRSTLRAIQARVLTELKKLETELGVTFSTGKGMYGQTTGSIGFDLAIRDASGAAQSRPEADFKRYASQYGLSPDDLGRPFIVNGTSYVLIGANPSAPKYPLLGQRRGGATYKFTADSVRRGLLQRPQPPAPSPSLPPARPSAAASALQDRLFG